MRTETVECDACGLLAPNATHLVVQAVESSGKDYCVGTIDLCLTCRQTLLPHPASYQSPFSPEKALREIFVVARTAYMEATS